MDFLRLVKKRVTIRFLLIVTLFSLQSCSNTPIGEKLGNSFDTTESPKTAEKATKNKELNKLKGIKKIKSNKNDEDKENTNIKGKMIKENLISNKDRFNQKSTKSIKKVIFNPQPYRIILKLSGTNPSAPAETVTNALIKAGVQFEVEKIERFEEEKLLKDSSLKRKGF